MREIDYRRCFQYLFIQFYSTCTSALLNAPPSARPIPSAAAIKDPAVSCSSFVTNLCKFKLKREKINVYVVLCLRNVWIILVIPRSHAKANCA